MKIAQILAVGLLVAGIGVSTEASAAPRPDRVVYVEHDRGFGYDRGYRDNRDYRNGYDRRYSSRRHGYRGHYARRCVTKWRHHRRVTICR